MTRLYTASRILLQNLWENLMEKASANVPYPDECALRKVENASPPTIARILSSIHANSFTQFNRL
jgi:hypothetical protein